MKLYHFTAKRFLKDIQKEGLTKGHFPLLRGNGKIGFMKNCQWLTKRQGWDQVFHDPELTKLAYDRREVRLTIVIPKSRQLALLDKPRMVRTFERVLIPDFFAYEDCDNWFLFYGRVKAQWIRAIDINPDFENVHIS